MAKEKVHYPEILLDDLLLCLVYIIFELPSRQ